MLFMVAAAVTTWVMEEQTVLRTTIKSLGRKRRILLRPEDTNLQKQNYQNMARINAQTNRRKQTKKKATKENETDPVGKISCPR